MQIKQRGFSLLETLIAVTLSTLLLLGTMRLLPALQLNVLNQTEQAALQDDLWLLAFTIGKHLQRAGYCRGSCMGEPLRITKSGDCVLLQWDANSNGKWESAAAAEPELTGYRLRDGSLETQRGANGCGDKGWERLTDPALLQITRFSIEQRKRRAGPPLLLISLAAQPLRAGATVASVEHCVVGYNL